MNMPAWLLLLWSGAAATCAAAVAGAVLGSRRGGWLLLPAVRPHRRAAVLSLAAGILAYPVAYGVVFEATSRDDVVTGLILGTVHGIVVLLASRPRADVRLALRAAGMHVIYGAVIALLYVTP
jgi:hypothetical protein